MTTAASNTELIMARSGVFPDLIGSKVASYISGALSKAEKQQKKINAPWMNVERSHLQNKWLLHKDPF